MDAPCGRRPAKERGSGDAGPAPPAGGLGVGGQGPPDTGGPGAAAGADGRQAAAEGRCHPSGGAGGVCLWGTAGEGRCGAGVHAASAAGAGGGSGTGGHGRAEPLRRQRTAGGGGRPALRRAGADRDGAGAGKPLRAAGCALRRRHPGQSAAAGVRRFPAAVPHPAADGRGGCAGAVRGPDGPATAGPGSAAAV